MADHRHPPDDDLTDIEAILRELDDDDLAELDDPPAAVWAGIERTLGDEQPADTAVPSLSAARRRRTRTFAPLLVAAAAVALVVAGAALVTMLDDDMTDDDMTQVATAELTYDPDAFDPLGAEATARAALVDDGRAIRLQDASLPAELGEAADLELWLIRTDDAGGIADLVSLGVVGADDATFPVPDGIDPDDYSVVDISVEPRDGDPTHSGRSILRGSLDA